MEKQVNVMAENCMTIDRTACILWNGMQVPAQFPYLNVLLQGRPQHEMDDFSACHPRMERGKRAKLFAPFDALDGYGENIREKDTVYVDRIALDESEKEELNRRLSILRDLTRDSRMARANRVVVTVTYYVLCTDEYSFACGIRGQYRNATGIVCKVDTEEKQAIIVNGITVSLNDILCISASDERIFDAHPEE